eukprot:INCI7059.4.p1 GENE.INCI7059.4~~INCI7059.4.p1  ORF type:complete len:788 (+),score=116.86 INCI7059.4:103-2364(+)
MADEQPPAAEAQDGQATGAAWLDNRPEDDDSDSAGSSRIDDGSDESVTEYGDETTTQVNSLYEAFGDLSLVYLRKALSREGVSTVGTKPELASRLVSVVSEAQDYAEELEKLNMVELRRLAFENNVKESERDAILRQLMINYRDKRVPKLYMGMSLATATLKSYVVAGKEGLTTRKLISTERNAMVQVSFLNAEPVTAVRFVTALDRGRLEFQRDIYQMPLRALFNCNVKKLDSSGYWIKPYFDITADLDVSAEIITDLMIETYLDNVFERTAQTPEYSSSAIQRMVVALPYHVMVALPQLAHIRESVSETLNSQPTPVEFALVPNLMAAALAYAVPISSLEEEKDTLRMPEWNKARVVEKEIFLIHIGLGFSSCAGFHMTSDSGESDRAGNSYNTTGGDADTPTLVSLSQKSLPFGTKDFIDQIVDSPKFSSAINRHLAEFSSQYRGVQFNHSKDFVYKSFETYMAVWAERIGQQIKATKSAAERDAVLVREDNVKINFSMYSDHKATFKLSVGEVYRMCGPVWKTIQNLVVQTFRECNFRTVPTVLFIREDKNPVPLLWHKIRNLAARLQKAKRSRIERELQQAPLAKEDARGRNAGGGASTRRSTRATPRGATSPSKKKQKSKAAKSEPLPRNVTLPSSCFETGATICAFLSWAHKYRRRPQPRNNHPWARFAHRMYIGNWESEDRLGAGPRRPIPDNALVHGVGGGGRPNEGDNIPGAAGSEGKRGTGNDRTGSDRRAVRSRGEQTFLL